jgi:hypothetical protein
MNKICIQCKIEKNLEFFTKNKNCDNGREGICKKCTNLRNNNRKIKNKIELIERRLSLYHNDIGKSGKTAMMQRYRDNFEKNPVREKAKRAKGSMISAKRKHNIVFDENYFTIDKLESMLIESSHCPCCGVKFVLHWGTNRKPEPKSPSYDRFIPQLGYVKGNVFLICWRCNNLKRDATAEELFKIAEWMSKTQSTLVTITNE